MSVANLTDDLFTAIEQRYAVDAELLQMVGRLFIDFVPETLDDGTKPAYPLIMVEQGEEGGSTEPGPGGRPVFEAFVIRFNVASATRGEAGRIAWQIASNFGGDSANDEWTGTYPGVTVIGCTRVGPPYVAQVQQGECEASVSFVVMATPNDTAIEE